MGEGCCFRPLFAMSKCRRRALDFICCLLLRPTRHDEQTDGDKAMRRCFIVDCSPVFMVNGGYPLTVAQTLRGSPTAPTPPPATWRHSHPGSWPCLSISS